MTPIEYSLHATILKVENLTVSLGGKRVLSDLSLEVRDVRRPGRVTGQVVGLLGPSGIGKTSLFRALAGLEKPESGRILVGEEARPVQTGMVGVVAQDYPLFAHRTVLGNLEVAGRQSGLSRAAARAKALGFLERFELQGHEGKYPVQLSGGQKQRVAIAQQFMCSDHFLLMDEPFSGLDLMAVERVCELINEVASLHELNTIIVVTHDITAAMAVADTLWLMGRDRDAAGKIIPGAKIVGSYNLLDRGLCWRKGITAEPAFLELLGEIRNRFREL